MMYPFAALLMLTVRANGQPPAATIPDARLIIAYRQVTDGKPDKVILESWLTCSQGDCEIVTVTLNYCLPGIDQSDLDVGRSSTSLGDLKVTGSVSGKTGVISAEEEDSGATIKYRFQCDLEPGGGYPRCGNLTGFSGAAVKDSALLKRTITWELQPFKGEHVPFKPDCPVVLHGIP